MVTSLFRVGQSVLMRAREGEMAARQHRTLRLGRIILSVRVSQVESGAERGPESFYLRANPR